MNDQQECVAFQRTVLYRIPRRTIVDGLFTERKLAIRVGWFDDRDSFMAALNAIPCPEGALWCWGGADVDGFPERLCVPPG